MLLETKCMIVRGFVMKYAFFELKAQKIFAKAADGIKSVRLMKKQGMTLEDVQTGQTKDNSGNWADVYVYGIVRN